MKSLAFLQPVLTLLNDSLDILPYCGRMRRDSFRQQGHEKI